MNQHGIISLSALCMMFVLAMAIATVSNFAARQADIVKFFKIENELQFAAEDCFNEVINNLSSNQNHYGELADNTPKIFELNRNLNGRNMKLTICLRKFVADKKIVVMILIDVPNYNHGTHSFYKKIYGYMSAVEDSEDEKYKFKGYFY